MRAEKGMEGGPRGSVCGRLGLPGKGLEIYMGLLWDPRARR